MMMRMQIVVMRMRNQIVVLMMRMPTILRLKIKWITKCNVGFGKI